jgi:hypothetical protein
MADINIIQLEWIFKIVVPHPKEFASKLQQKIVRAILIKLLQEAATINKTTIPQKKIHLKHQSNQTEPKTWTVHPNDLYAKKPTPAFALPQSRNKTHNQRIAIINPYNNVNKNNSK